MNQRRADIERAFDLLKRQDKNGFAFQRIARKLLRRQYPNLNPLPDQYDLGQDAIGSSLSPIRHDDREYSFSFSQTDKLSKLREDCDRCRQQGHKIDVMVFTAWGAVSGYKRKLWQAEVMDRYSWGLLVHDKECLLDEAELPTNEDLVADELQVYRPKAYVVLGGANGTSRPGLLNASCRIVCLDNDDAISDLARKAIKLGIEQRDSWKLNEAVGTFTALISDQMSVLSTQDLARTHRHLGATFRDLGQQRKAKQEFVCARDLDPDDIKNHLNVVVSLLDRSYFKAARKQAHYVLERFAPNAQALTLYALALGSLGRNEEALEALDEALLVDGDFIAARINRGVLLRRRGDLLEALAEFETACENASSDQHFAQAIRLETMVHLHIDGIAAQDLGAIVRGVDIQFARLERNGRARPRTLDLAMAILHDAKGLALLYSENAPAAVDEFVSALGYSDEPALHQNLAMAYLKQQRNAEAEAELRKAMAQGSRNEILLHNLVNLDLLIFLNENRDTGRLAEAQELLHELREMRPDSPETDMLDALMHCAESHFHGDDRGLSAAKALFRKLTEHKTCPFEISTVAFDNLRRVEEREEAYTQWKQEQFLLEQMRLGRLQVCPPQHP